MTNETFSVTQVARVVGIAPNTVRAWTDRFDIDAQAEAGEERRYTAEDVSLLRSVKLMRDQGESMKRIAPRIADGERLEPSAEKPPNLSEAPQKRATGDPGSSVITEREARISTEYAKLQGEFDAIKLERDFLRDQLATAQDRVIELTERAATAEAKLSVISPDQPAERRPWYRRLFGG